MSVTVTNLKSLEFFDGNNSTSTPYPIDIDRDRDEDIYLLVDGVAETGFTISPDGLRTDVAVPSGTQLTVYRATPRTQEIPFPSNTTPDARDIASALAKNLFMLQEMSRDGNPNSRSLKFPVSEPDGNLTELPVPADRLASMIYFNEVTGAMEVKTTTEIAEILALDAPAALSAAESAASAAASAASAVSSAASAVDAAASEAAAEAALAAMAGGLADDSVSTIKVQDEAITNAKLANMAEGTVKARTTAGAGDPEDIPLADLRDALDASQTPIEVTGSITAAVGKTYYGTAAATYTDPTPVQGKGFGVLVVSGAQTVGGTAYSTAGTIIRRIYNSAAWVSHVTYPVIDEDSFFTNSPTRPPSQQSVKAYIAANASLTGAVYQGFSSVTSVDFINIPSGVKRVTASFYDLSSSGVSPLVLRLGEGSIYASGYLGGVSNDLGRSVVTTGFGLNDVSVAAVVYTGNITLVKINPNDNIWVATGTIVRTDNAHVFSTAGTSALLLFSDLQKVRLTSVGGTDTLAGSMNIYYES